MFSKKEPMIQGPDISFYQKDDTTQPIQFAMMKDKAEFIILRAGQGDWEDSEYKNSYAGAGAVGLPRGAYWYYDNRYHPQRQAELFAKTVQDAGKLELEMWVDIEQREYTTSPYAGWKNWYDFIERLKQLTTARIGIYTGAYYWKEFTQAAPPVNLRYFGQYPLWIAQYPNNPNGFIPTVPAPWIEWTYWQYTDQGNGRAYGVQSAEIDLNFYNGSLDDFRARYKITQTEKEDTPMYLVEVKLLYKTNLRPNPNTDNTPIASYAAGTIMRGNEIVTLTTDIFKGTTRIGMAGDQWLKVLDVNGISKTGYIALKHMGSTGGYPIIVRDDRGTSTPPTEPPAGEDKVVKVVLYWESGKVEELP